ncbi:MULTISPECIES: hypothetical protein [unclassified Rhodococcus (in: high G+C Gram-positive bacteria)]|uniref:hypothetical protein n=1 Tax=unclassified Rhodococcus (in: high G+C Gram-positive bacteria) TaxID=192944 RepID=UPI0024B79918|nr:MULTISPECIES: hypothetical protein [unclassified Rhodococcus (in: high G+C Gram-positive bacteria)]MDI9959581.1 hypothetical protein [Rhodococcus sp. IEGM 1237]MDI9965381.1 hypothetical protein [Rhodococcus sp. IEGM 1251]MDV8127744.1 hypothetical protein [Rhodococcus sp. IEGM 1304]
MYAPHNNPEMQERREHGRRGPHRGHGFRRGFEGERPEGRFEDRAEGRPEGRRGRFDQRGHGRPHFGEAGAALRPAMGLLRGAAVAVAAGGTAEQVAKAEAILAEARRALFEMLAEKSADAQQAHTESTDTLPAE